MFGGENSSELASAVAGAVGLSGVESVDVDGESLSIHSALVSKYEITAANPQFITKFAELSGGEKLQALVADKEINFVSIHQTLKFLMY